MYAYANRDKLASKAKARRDRNAAKGLCINGAHHGAGKPRCEWCRLVHRVGVEVAVREALEDPGNVQPPPGWKRLAPRTVR